MKENKNLIIALIAVLIIALVLAIVLNKSQEDEFISVKSKSQLMKISKSSYSQSNTLLNAIAFPFMFQTKYVNSYDKYEILEADIATDTITTKNNTAEAYTKEYSTTNVQVENVDEADIVKTDGNYIYSLSGSDVVITNVTDPTNIKIESKIGITDDFIAEDLILYNNYLVVISSKYINYYEYDTSITVYDITNKAKPKEIKSLILYEQYYTSRCINGKLLIIASGNLRKEDDEIITYYLEDNNKQEIELSNIKYLKNLITNTQTLIASIDLDSNREVSVNSYLFDVSNAYISENNMYLLSQDYDNNANVLVKENLKTIFGFKGIIGAIKEIDNNYYEYNSYTTIYKFNISDDGDIKYSNKTKVKGTTINQFSLDEYDDNLRIGLYTTQGSRVVVFDKNLKLLGETEYLSKGEKMYSTRFMGNKAYMVTYKNVDPLYVIDLSNPENPTVLGKLKIPGYSTYLHPYDETHLIGIGMQTEEHVNRNSYGKVISTTATITGMKMAIFDVSDVSNPIQISETLIGDSRTTSAILTNHKALLFSAKKGIIAIPVNGYPSDFEVSIYDSDISSIENLYINYGKKYTSEGYFVYDINLEDGFKFKGSITHEKSDTTYKYSMYNNSRLLRGLWIEDDLYTVSEDMIKVNNLETLEQISEIKI